MSFKWGKTMPKLTKLKQLRKNVADTQAAFAAAWDDAWHTDAVWDAADAVYDDAAYAALVKARRELAKYLKEQDK